MNSISTLTRAIIFDLDDTLFLERDFAVGGFHAVARAFAHILGDANASATRMIELFDTEHRPRVFDRLLGERSVPENRDLVRAMIDTYREHRPTIQLLPDAERALARFHGRVKLGIITDGYSVTQWNKIDALGLRERVDEIIVTSDLGDADCADRSLVGAHADYAKPCPLAFELMAERLGVAAVECTYVADNALKDFVAPRALRWRTVQIQRTSGVHTAQPLRAEAAPDQVIDTLDALGE